MKKIAVLWLLISLTGCAAQRYDNAVVANPPFPDTGAFILPVKGKVVLGYGAREDGVTLKGMVLESSGAGQVFAARPGEVAFADERMRGYGKTLILRHANNFSTVYARNSKILVRPGERVKAGQPIAIAGGGPGNSRRLYFEIRKDSKPVDPEIYLRNHREF